MGNITSDEAFSFPLAEAQRRASRKTWVLPIVLLTARVHFPTDIRIKALKIVYNMAPGVNSWGVTLGRLPRNQSSEATRSLPPKCGSMHSMALLFIPSSKISRCLSPLVYLYLFPFQAVCFYFLFFVP